MLGRTSRFLSSVYRIVPTAVRGMLGPASTEDVAQEVAFQADQARRGGTLPPWWRPWVYRVARNRGIDIDRRRRRQAAALRVMTRSIDRPHKLPHDIIDLMRRTLDARQIRIVRLRVEFGLTFREIVTQLGLSLTAERVGQVYRDSVDRIGREMLREEFE